MDKRIKRRWIKALLSGKYKQAETTLRQGDERFCCLGVLCDLFHKQTGEGRWTKDPTEDDVYGFNGKLSYLPPAVQKWAGLKEEDPGIENDTLSGKNDSGMPFPRIAELIDKYL